MQRILACVQSREAALIGFLREMVECESPSDDAAAVNRFVELVAERIGDIARVKTVGGGKYGKLLLAEFDLPGRRKSGRILALGHSDTVWPVGTLKTMPWREEKGRLWGPGVFDMKAGIALFVFAMRALRELDLPVGRKVVLLLNPDEEVGSPSSRAVTEREAKRSEAVLVLEPGAGLDGKVKTGRKGIGDFRVTVRGVPAHSGLDFAAGASAILELARQIEAIRGFTKLERGVTVNVGVIRGGSRANVVAGEAEAEVDVRVPRLRDWAPLERKFRGLRVTDRRCKLEVAGGLNRPPLERTAGVVGLYRKARALAGALGVELEECSVGGGSDGNFTAGLGVPTLDGIGGVGEGAHAAHESVLVDRIADRAALLAGLVRAL